MMENNNKKGFGVWWQLLRPHTLTAGFVPVLIGTMYARLDHPLDWGLFLAMMFAALLIQAATNMFNEYYDWKRGLDHAESVGIGGAIVRHGVNPATIMKIAFTFYGVAFLLGIYICANTSWWILVIGAVAMLFGYLYTGGPYPIAYSPFGEVVAGTFMGYVIIAISYYLQAGEMTLDVLWISIAPSILIANILTANNIRDLDNDKHAGRKTFSILLGKKVSIAVLAILYGVVFVWLLMMPLLSITPFWTAIAFGALPKAIQAIEGLSRGATPSEMMPGMIAAAKTNTIFGLLFAIGLLLSVLF